MGRDDYGGQGSLLTRNSDVRHANVLLAGQNVEMEPLAQNGSQFGQGSDPNAILNACRDVDRGMQEIKAAMGRLDSIQKSILNMTNSQNGTSSDSSKQLDFATSEIMAMFRDLTGQVKNIKQKPESGSPRNAPQVRLCDKKLKEIKEEYQVMEAGYTRKLRDQAARQYRIVNPNATEQEISAAIDNNTDKPIFSQALMQSDRRGESQSALREVTSRHQEIQRIVQQMEELATMFNDMDNLVVQQEAAVVAIEMKGEEVVENLDKGNEQIGTAIQSARNTRKWKWWCLGISGTLHQCASLWHFFCHLVPIKKSDFGSLLTYLFPVLIVIIIVIIVLIYKFVIQNNNSTTTNNNTTTAPSKRFVLTDILPASKLTLSRRIVIPGGAWPPPPPSKAVVPMSRKFRRFAA